MRTAPRKEAHSDKGCPRSLRAALRTGETVRCGVVSLCLALVLAGCSSEPQGALERPSATVSATAEPDRSEAEPLAATESATAEPGLSEAPVLPPEGSGAGGHGGDQQGDEEWPRRTLAGMYPHHPERMFQMEQWEGIVSIEPPCVYFYFDPGPKRLWADETRGRLALSLSYPEARFDEDTQTLWYGDIPIAHGDRVLTGGGENYTVGGKQPSDLHLFWNACTAHGLGTSFGLESVEWYCAQGPPDWPSAKQEWQRICVEDTRPRNQRDLLEQQGLAPFAEPPAQGRGPGGPPAVAELMPPPLHGMYPYHPDMEIDLAMLVGILSIEQAGPNFYSERECAYLYVTASSAPQAVLWGDSWKHADPDGQPLAVLLDLPYPQVRFDEDAWALWNGDIGPMGTGDRVIVDPLGPPDFNDTGYGSPKQPHETLINVACDKANARATVLDMKTVEHYCTHDTPVRHQSQCEQAMSLRSQPQTHLALPDKTPE